MRFKAVLFDLDGTLLDTLQDLADSMNQVLSSHGYPTHGVSEYRYLVGYGVRELVKRALPEHARADSELVDLLTAAMREEYGKRWENHTVPYPGVLDMLESLEVMGVPKSIFSNKPDDFTKLTVNRFLYGFEFDLVQGIKEGIPPKPDPAGALLVASSMKIDPERFLYVGDTSTDMQTALAAGMHPLGVLWGFRDRAELVKSGAELVLEYPSELVDLF